MFGWYSALALADADGDGDLDLFIGNSSGNTYFFRNTGSATTPAYKRKGGNKPFGIGDVGYSASPAFADIDDDGDLDLFIGNSGGYTAFFRNTALVPVAPVHATSSNGTYAIGEVINLTVSFNEAVLVDTSSGTITLQLETGSSDRCATYTSGSGSSSLTFQYTVKEGDNTTDLDQLSSSSLTLNGGTINDAAGNPANLTLAAPGETGSLAANADLAIDGVAPTVTGLDSTTIDGTYTIGDVINLTVGFSEAVIVDTNSGTPKLQLHTGNTDRHATYISGSGSSTLTFQYTVQNGDSAADLDHRSTDALILDGGSINDAAGNPAILTLATPGNTGSLAANSDLLIDGVRPTVTRIESITSDGIYGIKDVITLAIGFSKPLLLTPPQVHQPSSSKPAALIGTPLTPQAQAVPHSPSNTPFKPAIPPQISINSPLQLSSSMAAASPMSLATQPSSPSLNQEPQDPLLPMPI